MADPVPGVTCQSCGIPFALRYFQAERLDLLTLPDPFEATCPLCKATANHPKSSIRNLGEPLPQ